MKMILLVLMGMQTAFKDDINATSVELVFGEGTKLFSKLLIREANADISMFLEQLKTRINFIWSCQKE